MGLEFEGFFCDFYTGLLFTFVNVFMLIYKTRAASCTKSVLYKLSMSISKVVWTQMRRISISSTGVILGAC